MPFPFSLLCELLDGLDENRTKSSIRGNIQKVDAKCNRPYSCVMDLQPYHKLTAVVQMNHRLSKVTQGLGYTRLRLSKVTQGLGYRRLRRSKETSFGGEDK